MKDNIKTNFTSKNWLATFIFSIVVCMLSILWIILSSRLVFDFEAIITEYYCWYPYLDGKIAVPAVPFEGVGASDIFLEANRRIFSRYNFGMIAICILFAILTITSFCCFMAKKHKENLTNKHNKNVTGLCIYLFALSIVIYMFVAVWNSNFLSEFLYNAVEICEFNFYKLENGVAVLYDVPASINDIVVKPAYISATLLMCARIATGICLFAMVIALCYKRYKMKKENCSYQGYKK